MPSAQRGSSLAGALLVAVLSLIGCGQSEGEFINQFASAYCSKLSACYPVEFAEAYPQRETDCVATFTRGLTKQQLDASAACSGQQQQQCEDDVDALTCGTGIEKSPVPSSCTCP